MFPSFSPLSGFRHKLNPPTTRQIRFGDSVHACKVFAWAAHGKASAESTAEVLLLRSNLTRRKLPSLIVALDYLIYPGRGVYEHDRRVAQNNNRLPCVAL